MLSVCPKTREGSCAPLSKHKGRFGKARAHVLFFTALVVSLFACGLVAIGVASADPLALSSPPTHHKSITDKGDGSYDVTLSVTGEQKETETQTSSMADVVIVFDKSGSMRASATDSKTRLEVAIDATKKLASDLHDSGSDVRVAFIDFSNRTDYLTSTGLRSATNGVPAVWLDTRQDSDISFLNK
jgi:hypothetical protein